MDACIADAIKMLWDNDVVTAGCCCGHNGAFGNPNPNVIIETGHDTAQKAADLLAAFDSRHWEVLQWRLCELNDEKWEEWK